jgi:hypothetical protein
MCGRHTNAKVMSELMKLVDAVMRAAVGVAAANRQMLTKDEAGGRSTSYKLRLPK